MENSNWYTYYSTYEESRGISVPLIYQGKDPRFDDTSLPVYSRSMVLNKMERLPSFHICDWGEDRWPVGRKVYNRQADHMPCLHFMVGGKGLLNGIPLEENTAFVTDPSIPYSMVSQGEEPFHYFWVRVQVDLSFFKELGLFRFGEDGVGRFDFSYCREDVIRLFRKGFSASGNNGWALQLGFYGLFFEIMSRCASAAIRPREISPYVKQAREYIRMHYAEEINVNRLAEEMHLSRTHLRRLFLRDLGIAPSEYIMRVRMNLAATLLEKRTSMSLAQLAVAVGYPSYSQFLQAFRKEFGCNPKDYVKTFDTL